jgi:hypothetical protein
LGDDGEPITFHQREDAAEFLRGLLWLSLPGDLSRRRAMRVYEAHGDVTN